jgi:hypothetical protein
LVQLEIIKISILNAVPKLKILPFSLCKRRDCKGDEIGVGVGDGMSKKRKMINGNTQKVVKENQVLLFSL